MMAEEWRQAIDWPGYEVSSIGRVRSWVYRGPRPKVLRSHLSSSGYPTVGLHRDRVARPVNIHVLVATAWHGPRPDGFVVRHLDGTRINNRPSNLRWGTNSENTHDKKIHGTDHNAAKTHCPQGHPYDAANTYVATTRLGHVQRNCRACNRAIKARSTSRRAS